MAKSGTRSVNKEKEKGWKRERERVAVEDGELVMMGKGQYLVMVTEEEEALMVKVLESFVGDEPFHSSKVMVLLDTDEDASMPR